MIDSIGEQETFAQEVINGTTVCIVHTVVANMKGRSRDFRGAI